VRVEEYACCDKNLAKTLVWKHEYGVKLWRHKQRTPNTNDHHMPLNNPLMKIFCVSHWILMVDCDCQYCNEQYVRIILNVLLKVRPHKVSWCSLKPNLKKTWSFRSCRVRTLKKWRVSYKAQSILQKHLN